MSGCVVRVADGVMVTVKVTPRARRESIEGHVGDPLLRVRVTAPPEDGKANAAVLALLAEALGVPKSALAIASGHTARLKRIVVHGDPVALERHLAARLAAP